MKLLQSLPYSLAEPGPSEVDGVGNCKYMNPIVSPLNPLQISSRYAQATPPRSTSSRSTFSIRTLCRSAIYRGKTQTTTTSSRARLTGFATRAPPSSQLNDRSRLMARMTSVRSGGARKRGSDGSRRGTRNGGWPSRMP